MRIHLIKRQHDGQTCSKTPCSYLEMIRNSKSPLMDALIHHRLPLNRYCSGCSSPNSPGFWAPLRLPHHLPAWCSEQHAFMASNMATSARVAMEFHGTSSSGWWFQPSEKYESQFGWLFLMYGTIKHVPNHQPVICNREKKHQPSKQPGP